MEREIAKVATACHLRAFRYIPFAGIEFDPFPIVPVSEESGAPVAKPATGSPALTQPVTPIPAPVADLTPITIAPMAASTPVPLAVLPALATMLLQPPPAPQQRYRMLRDLALEQHPLPAPIPPPAPVAAPKGTTFATGRPTIRPAMPAVRAAHAGPQLVASPPSAVPQRGTTGSPRGTPHRAWRR
jgi:hypothetical protein